MKNLKKVICGVMAVVSIATGMMSVSADETKWETHYVSAQSGLNCRIKPSTEDSEVTKVLQVIQMVKQKANILVDLKLHIIVHVIHVMAQIVVVQRGQDKLSLVKLLQSIRL